MVRKGCKAYFYYKTPDVRLLFYANHNFTLSHKKETPIALPIIKQPFSTTNHPLLLILYEKKRLHKGTFFAFLALISVRY